MTNTHFQTSDISEINPNEKEENLQIRQPVLIEKTDKKYKALMLFGFIMIVLGTILSLYSLNKYFDDINYQKEYIEQYASLQNEVTNNMIALKIFTGVSGDKNTANRIFNSQDKIIEMMPQLPSDNSIEIIIDIIKRKPESIISLSMIFIGLITSVYAIGISWWKHG
ncbi:MAG: hypothetical protein K9M03_01485 [Kiritimatiellales bacterium]|nr:hypothetical protein [Kiritimatiellales bacterium]